MTDADILAHLLDRIEREDFVAGLQRQYAHAPRDKFVDLEDV